MVKVAKEILFFCIKLLQTHRLYLPFIYYHCLFIPVLQAVTNKGHFTILDIILLIVTWSLCLSVGKQS